MPVARHHTVAALAATVLSIATVGCQISVSGGGDRDARTASLVNRGFAVAPGTAAIERDGSQAAGSAVLGAELAAVSAQRAGLSGGEAPRVRQRFPAYQRDVPGTGFLIAHLRSGRVALHQKPGGKVLARIRSRTEFGSKRVLAVVGRAEKGRWLKVIAPELKNNAAAWIDARGMWLRRSDYALVADVSARRVTVYRNHRRVGSFPVAVGRRGSETPRGVFSVTDKLLVTHSTPYGCCVLALSGHQPQVPQGWGGGDRLGIHATDNPTSIGYAASLGCLRASERVMRKLVYSVPLGARVFIRD